ncbi:CAF17-like 4Fe-4S cluster assembly/insertion protein YgfZ [Massilia glaciei]|uniref:Folate-binding protein n=1 Tax=Massilia glaciei TaxID=1524097 RepID=A0A2U2HG83_9BURK|nr:folate-binding protein YgfZ [Massilia glaciei]PWF43940.1 folate-binding protein [Massilia glaciei]
MKNWNDYLLAMGGRAAAGAVEGQPLALCDFGQAVGVASLADGFVAPITDMGLIAVSGEDAARFLHGQLTNDVEHLPPDQARLAGYCTPKGRLQASFLMWRDSGTIFLQLPRAIQAPLQKRLAMFVMRAKAKLADATDAPANAAVIGIGGAKGGAVLEQLAGTLPPMPYGKVEGPAGTVIRLADALGAPRYQWLTSAETARAAWPALSSRLAVGGNDAWQLSSIHAGVPTITAKTQEQFVPQMINFELLGAVNFKKGCYPGQEIVARSQYLGKLKRRAVLAGIDGAPAHAGDEVFAASDPGQPSGMVVNAAPNGAGGTDVLVEIKLAAMEQGDLHLGSATGAALRIMPMPYALDALEL